MRGSQAIISFAAAAAILALGVAGCKYSAAGSPFPNPSGAPTFPPGVVTEAPIPTAASTPLGIAAGPDSNMWFAENNGNKIARIVPATMAITEFPIPTSASQPIDVTRGPTGNPFVWFDEFVGNKIARIDPSTGTISEFGVPTSGAGPVGLTADPSGNLWFGEFFAAKIASITPSGIITEYPITYGGNTPVPDAVVIAPDHTIWFLDVNNNVVVHMTFPGPTFQEFALLTAINNPQSIAVGSDGNLWFTELGQFQITGCRIGRVNLGGSPSVSEFVLPNQPFPYGDWCSGIALGSDGNMWFAETGVGAIGRIKTNGAVTEYGIPGSGTTAVGMAGGPDSDMWFTDGNFGLPYAIGTNQVGKVNIGLLPASSIHKQFQVKITTTRLTRIPEHGAFVRKK